MHEVAIEYKSLVDQFLAELDNQLKKLVFLTEGSSLSKLIEYHMGWRNERLEEVGYLNVGKRSRPTLCVLSHLLFSQEYNRVIPVAAAIEMIHNFSLVFDDIQDHDPIRRGRNAVWKNWGEDVAINVGCAMHTLTYKTLEQMFSLVEQSKAMVMIKDLSDYMLRICTGQQQDLEMTNNCDLITSRQYLEMIYSKTAALFEAASYLGAYCANANYQNLHLCKQLGKYVGMACQIFDDVMGIWGLKEKGLDKPSTDLEKRKKTFPIIYADRCAGSRDKAILRKYYSLEPFEEDDISCLLELLEKKNARVTTLMVGLNYLTKAIGSLAQIKAREDIKQEIGDQVRNLVTIQLSTIEMSELSDVRLVDGLKELF